MKLIQCLAAIVLLSGAAVPAHAAEDKEPAATIAAPPAAEAAPPAPQPAQTAAPADALAPYGAIRSLQTLQDLVAHGSTSAQAAQAKLLTHIAEVFASADPAVWKDRRNSHAAVLFLFSAGKPSVIRALLDHAVFAPDSDRLLKGALAYAEGEDQTARALLGKIDPRSLPQSVGGHLALILATLYAHQDPQKASQMLDTARLLVPGSLVEEAALRRQIFLLADVASLDKFSSLSRQYIRRFRGSVFAANFKQRLTSFATGIAVTGDVTRLAKLDNVLSELPPADRRAIYLTLARAALVEGKTATGRYAADKAVLLADDTSADGARAKLYAAAATAPSDDADQGRSSLTAVDPQRLSTRDAELRDAALAVARTVEADTFPGSDSGPMPATPADAASAALIDHANQAIAATDSLLGSPQ